MPVVAAGEVADEALQRTYDIVTHMLAGRPDILEAMVKNGTRLIIIGKDQVYTDMPEYRNHPNPAYQNERVRGTGGLGVTSFGEENLLNLRARPLRRREHRACTSSATRSMPPCAGSTRPGASGWARPTAARIDKGLWKYAYAASNQGEYWAEICQSYFDCNRINNWNHASIATREQLKLYDPDGYELVRTTFKLTPETRLALPAAARAAERHAAAGEVQDRPVLHEVHLRPRVHGAGLEARERRGAAQGQRHDPQDVRLPARHPQGDDRGRRSPGCPRP